MTAATTSQENARRARMDAINQRINECRRCPGLNLAERQTESAPGSGPLDAPVVLVGESLCHACMVSHVPFTGGSERVLKDSFTLADVDKRDVFITNAVHCHPHSEPRDNRDPTPDEIDNCRPHLRAELDVVAPRLVIGLGRYAKAALRAEYPDAHDREREPSWFRTPPTEATHTGFDLLLVKHPYWIMTRPRDVREQYISDLAAAMRWAFSTP